MGRPRGVHSDATASTDSDGDGYLDVEDSCPSTYNPCQYDGDLDYDGVPNDCDACPHDPSETGLRGRVVPDTDRDGIPDSCDCTIDAAESYYIHDLDGDFLMNLCDNCSGVYNPAQENADRDLQGDLCDGCPSTPWSSLHDSDEDEVPDDCDNCEGEYNPLQENCNWDAEFARGLIDLAAGAAGVGDACDPIPCGETALWNRNVPPPPGARRRTAMDEVRIDGVRAPEVAEPGYEAWTGTRFCRCTAASADRVASRDDCLDVQLDNTGGCAIADVPAYDAVDEPRRWRRASVAYVPPREPGPAPRTRYTGSQTEVLAVYDSPEGGADPDALGHWNQDSDLTRWASPPISDVIAFGPGTAMRGVFWTHTPAD
ncbi:MAG: thrombospondin type 3 repeat-containing protein, partial [Deltaproteobacteria bacterium]|nr:thrombospondin type 3 repeat-containing protein [Deltaproteobacteria bacterium]